MTTRTYATQANDMAGNARVRAFQPCVASCRTLRLWSPISPRHDHGHEARSAPTASGVPSVAARYKGAPPGRRGNPAAFFFVRPRSNERALTQHNNRRRRRARNEQQRGVSGDVRHPALSRRRHETIREPDWQDLARCNDGTGSMTELFFSEQLDDIAAAKAFCLECPVQGRLPRRRARAGASRGACGAASCSCNGKIVAQKRKRGRPPKVRPEADAPQAQSA